MPGTLFVVATPIGNLEDLTFRALRVLKEVDLIAAEDTRRTAKLLAHFAVRKPMVSLREHNETREGMKLVARMLAGESVALVSDAGTPGIADPGARLVGRARAAGIAVVPIPGASAVTAAVSISGYPGTEFAFMGFPPTSGVSRTEWFERAWAESRLVVFFESPHRIRRTLADLDALPKSVERQIIVNKELTKIHEKSVNWPTKEPYEFGVEARGEYVVVLFPDDSHELAAADSDLAVKMLGCLEEHCSLPRDRALELVSSAFGTTPSAVRKLAKRARYSVIRPN
jgi:16S rRNA (cytidine1402-2'-O)-methyltransferase